MHGAARAHLPRCICTSLQGFLPMLMITSAFQKTASCKLRLTEARSAIRVPLLRRLQAPQYRNFSTDGSTPPPQRPPPPRRGNFGFDYSTVQNEKIEQGIGESCI